MTTPHPLLVIIVKPTFLDFLCEREYTQYIESIKKKERAAKKTFSSEGEANEIKAIDMSYRQKGD